jgi:hypothetical protein
VLGCKQDTASVNLQLVNDGCVEDQRVPFDLHVGFVFMGWIEDEAPFHSFPTNFEPKPGKIFSGLYVCFCRVTE